jgi:hypothetical protein
MFIEFRFFVIYALYKKLHIFFIFFRGRNSGQSQAQAPPPFFRPPPAGAGGRGERPPGAERPQELPRPPPASPAGKRTCRGVREFEGEEEEAGIFFSL